MSARLTELQAGMAIPYGGDKVTFVTPELAADFRPGDRLIVVQDTGDLLRVPSDVWEVAAGAVTRAHEAFGQMGSITSDQLDMFYRRFAEALEDDRIFAPIAEANAADVESARRRGRSTTRLELTDRSVADLGEDGTDSRARRSRSSRRLAGRGPPGRPGSRRLRVRRPAQRVRRRHRRAAFG